MEDINTGLLKMINLRLVNDYNICSGKKTYLPNIISFLNKKFKKKIITYDEKLSLSLYGSNIKLKKKGWKIKDKNFFPPKATYSYLKETPQDYFNSVDYF